MYKYKGFIPQQIAPRNATAIGVYNADEELVCTLALGRLTPPSAEPLYSFGLVSDMHIYPIAAVEWKPETKFDNVLTYFENEGCTFCTHCGDFTQTGLYLSSDASSLDTTQFAKYKEICDAHTIPVYGICGNHESIYGIAITNNLTELKEYTGTDLYYTVMQNNDLFIFIGQPTYNKVMSDDALQWLYDTLEENRNKRCFVFVHAYIEEDSGDPLDYRENSVFDDWGATKTGVFKSLLNHYKNTVLFHGHSHTKYECQELDKNANYTEKNGFRSVHVPSLGLPRDLDTDAGATVNDNSGSQGYVVDVHDNCIVLNGRDFIAGEWVPTGVLKIDTKLVEIEAGTFTDSTGTITT